MLTWMWTVNMATFSCLQGHSWKAWQEVQRSTYDGCDDVTALPAPTKIHQSQHLALAGHCKSP